MLWIVLAVAAAGINSSVSASVVQKLPAYRLPGDVIPRHYNLIVSTDLDQFIFSGSVDVKIECKNTTNVIKIHSKSLDISDKSVALKRVANNISMDVTAVTLDVDNDFIVIQVKERLVPGSLYDLHIEFQGNLTDGLEGYYRSSYKDRATNTTRWVASTQFEPTSARRAFPCFDEPAMKARFCIRLGHRRELQSVTNTFLSNTTEDVEKPGWVWDQYGDSVPMSTYIVAYMVSDLHSRQAISPTNNLLFRVWARKDAIDQTKFALHYNERFLSFYESYFGIKYPLEKLDSAAIPDFSAGAMENWGLVTYREGSLLVDENVTPVRDKYNVANTIAHELVHMWFGNLVTMRWWTDLWLNEGFATFLARLALQHEFPEWNAYNFEVTLNLLSIFPLDALKSSHSVSVPIGHPDEINQIFDAISYSKGAFLLHMMNAFLGGDVFRNGVKRYLEKFSYGNSETDDLWGELTEEAARASVLPPGQTVKSVMDSWTLQTGYPLVTVRREGGKVFASQKRFLTIRPKSGDRSKECWWIPITFSTPSDHNIREARNTNWLGCDVQELVIDTGAQPSDWIILNHRATGLYRVHYDVHTWTLLTDVLHSPNFTVIHELNRVQLILDAMSLAKHGLLEYRLAFRLLQYIRKERSYNPWLAASTSIDDIKRLLWRTEKFDQFKTFVQHLLSKLYKRFSNLTEVPQQFEEIKQKEVIVKLACNYQRSDCLQSADQLFKTWMSTGVNTIPKDIRGTVYCVGVKNGGQNAWEFIWNKYQTSNIASEKNLFLGAMACAENEILLTRYLRRSITRTSGIRRQDSTMVFVSVAQSTKLGYKLAREFLFKNIQRIHDHLSPSTEPLGRYINVLSSRMVFPDEVTEMKEFVAAHRKLLAKAKMQVDQALEFADSNLEWMGSGYSDISKALVVESNFKHFRTNL